MQDVLDVALLVAKAIDATGGEYFVGGSPDLESAFLDVWAVRLGLEALLTRARADASGGG